MDFRILGALEVWNGSEQISVKGRLHPKILVGLLLNTERTVPLSWLVDLLWDNDPPTTAQRQVQNAVAALRRQLEPMRPNLIERVGQDYRLNITGNELDLRRFEYGIRNARGLMNAGQWQSSIECFEDVLGLWRGSALNGFNGRILTAAATRLDDLYLSTYEEYTEAALRLGEPERVIDKLQELLDSYPLRQRLRARLMHALYQSQRVPEALRLFDDIRMMLADELGLDPGAELSDLHFRILQDDPSLLGAPRQKHSLTLPDWKSSPTTNPDRHNRGVNTAQIQGKVPAQLPSDVATFTGRTEHLATLDRLRDGGARTGIVSAITGIGGVGKTALAIHWGHTRRDDYPDGQLYINLRGFDEREPLTPLEAISRLLRAIGCSNTDVPSDIDEASALFRSLLADKRMLVLLDNARSAEQARPLLPASPGSLALITSRNQLSSLTATDDAQEVELGILSPSESVDLAVRLIGPDALEDLDITKRICVLCGHLPLALRIIAANLVQNPHQSMANVLADLESEHRLSQLRIDNDNSASITAVFDLSYRALSPTTRRVLHHLGLIPGDDFTADLAANMTRTARDTIETTFQELTAAHLLDQYQPQRYRFHDLVRLHTRSAAMRHIAKEAQIDAINRAVDWYSSMKVFSFDEFNNIIAMCSAIPEHPQLWKLVKVFRGFANQRIDIETSRKVTEQALYSAEKNCNVVARIDILTTLGALYGAEGDYAAAVAMCRKAAQLLPETTNYRLQGQVYGNLGVHLYNNGEHPRAEPYIRQSVQIAEELNNTVSLINGLANLGRVYRALGRFLESETHLLRSQTLASEANLPNYSASSLASLGFLYVDMGKYDKALNACNNAIEISETIGATRLSCLALQYIGRTHYAQGQFDAALTSFEKALKLARDERRSDIQIELLICIAETKLAVGEHSQVLARLTAIHSFLSTHSSRASDVAEFSRVSCRVLFAIGDTQQAIERGIQARDILRVECDTPLRLARSLDALGEAHQGNNDPAAARDCWTEALEIFTRLDVPEAPKLRAKLAALPTHP